MTSVNVLDASLQLYGPDLSTNGPKPFATQLKSSRHISTPSVMAATRLVIDLKPESLDKDLRRANERALSRGQTDLLEWREAYEKTARIALSQPADNGAAATHDPVLRLNSDEWDPQEIETAAAVAQKVNAIFGKDDYPDREIRKPDNDLKLVKAISNLTAKVSNSKKKEFIRLGLTDPQGGTWNMAPGALALLVHLNPTHGILKLMHYALTKEFHGDQQKSADGCHWPKHGTHAGLADYNFNTDDPGLTETDLVAYIKHIKENPSQNTFVGDWYNGSSRDDGKLKSDTKQTLMTPNRLTGLLGSDSHRYNVTSSAIFWMTLVASKHPIRDLAKKTIDEVNSSAIGMLPGEWSPGQGRFEQEMQRIKNRIIDSLNTGRRFIYGGVVCTVASFGVSRFRKIPATLRCKLWLGLYDLNKITMTEKMEREKAAKYMDLPQIFNRTSTEDVRARQVLPTWYRAKFTAICEEYYKHGVLKADFRKLSGEIGDNIDNWMATGWKGYIPASMQDEVGQLTWKDMPVNALGPNRPRNRGEKRKRSSMETDNDQPDTSAHGFGVDD